MHPTYAQRRASLLSLKQGLLTWEARFLEAVRLDLNKSPFEAYSNELGMLHAELNHALKHLKRWMKPQRRFPEPYLLPARAEIHPQPLGRALLIAPWNYPIQLALAPLIPALAAGNTVVLKPSELSVHCEAVLKAFIEATFDPAQVRVVTGGPEVTTKLLAEPFNKFFFTGSPAVGRIVARAAAEQLASVTLELGGKSPALVDGTGDLLLAARKIAWGKFNNAGQTCIAPDYVLVQESVRDRFLAALGAVLREFYGENPQTSPHYGRVINGRHFDRLSTYLTQGEVVMGGQTDAASRYIAPTVLIPRSWDEQVMADEIFGPILPVLTYQTPQDAIRLVNRNPQPLALYIFSEHAATVALWRGISFGGGGVNSTILHVASGKLPFGGIGTSGLGNYHGKAGFDAFTHYKSILVQPARFDLKLSYPNTTVPLSLLKRMLR